VDGRPDPEAGFTLIEVMAAMMLFLMVSTSTVVILVNGLQALRENSDRSTAANVARSEIEYLRDLARKYPDILPPGTFVGAIPPIPNFPYDPLDPEKQAEAVASLDPDFLDPILRDVGVSGTTKEDWRIETDSQLVDFASASNPTSQVSACAGTTASRPVVRVTVTVTSPTLKKPVSLQTNITQQQTTQASTGSLGAAAITVLNDSSVGVPNVVVTFADQYHPNNVRPAMTTGFDGCLFVPGLEPTGSLMVSIAKPGYVSSTPTGTSTQLSIGADLVTKFGFEYAPAASLRFGGTDAEFALPADTPVNWQVKGIGGTRFTAQLTDVVTGLWPGDEVQAWAGGCADADPISSRPSYPLVAGGTTVAGLIAAPVRLVGLNPEQLAFAVHTAGGCDVTQALGKADEDGVVKVGMPYGTWSFKADEEVIVLEAPLAPPAAGESVAMVTVTFLLQVDVKATPTPTPSPSPDESPSPSPSSSDPGELPTLDPSPSPSEPPGEPMGP
jgi:prepilin-type N-terminal cleavage/methylation domain-containing protein